MKEIKKSDQNIELYLHQDSDKEHFIDYIKVYMKTQSMSNQQLRVQLRRENIFNCLIRLYEEKLPRRKS